MISVEQIKALEARVEKALMFIGSLKADNLTLTSKLSGAEEARLAAEKRAEAAEYRVLELEDAAANFNKDQLRIEEGIVHALEKLDAFEDLVLQGDLVGAASVPSQPPIAQSKIPVAPPTPEPKASEIESKHDQASRREQVEKEFEEVVSEDFEATPTAASESRPPVAELDIF